jgi:hypothetical protein
MLKYGDILKWNGNKRGKNYANENLRAAIPNEDNDGSKTAGECEIFQPFR